MLPRPFPLKLNWLAATGVCLTVAAALWVLSSPTAPVGDQVVGTVTVAASSPEGCSVTVTYVVAGDLYATRSERPSNELCSAKVGSPIEVTVPSGAPSAGVPDLPVPQSRPMVPLVALIVAAACCTVAAFRADRPSGSAPPAVVPQGWYPDPAGVASHRWWDGTRWTTETR